MFSIAIGCPLRGSSNFMPPGCSQGWVKRDNSYKHDSLLPILAQLQAEQHLTSSALLVADILDMVDMLAFRSDNQMSMEMWVVVPAGMDTAVGVDRRSEEGIRMDIQFLTDIRHRQVPLEVDTDREQAVAHRLERRSQRSDQMWLVLRRLGLWRSEWRWTFRC